jgi:GNAT superfamily N-acetyltransferase
VKYTDFRRIVRSRQGVKISRIDMLTLVKRGLIFNVTEELDEDYLKYLRRRIGADRRFDSLFRAEQPSARLDISLDDDEGDVVAGIAAQTDGELLHIDLLWVEREMRGNGWGGRLVAMAEDIAVQRGCSQARLGTTGQVDYFRKLGYSVTGKLALFPTCETLYWMSKPLSNIDTLNERQGTA